MRKETLSVVLLLLVPTLLIFSWFKGGAYIAGGEENLTFYNSPKAIQTYLSPWLDFGLGYSSPFWLPRIPVYFFASLLSHVFSHVVIQMIIFWIILASGGLGMYFLTAKFIGRHRLIALFAAAFYILNLYSQSQVWARFVITGMVAWAYLPIFLYLFISWVESGRRKLLFLFLLSSVVFSHAFSHPSYIMTFWAVALLYIVVKVTPKKVPKNRAILQKTIFAIAGWVLVNIWWIYPYIKLQGSVVSDLNDWNYNFETIKGLSRAWPINELLVLKQKYYFEWSGYWGDLYSQFYMNLIALMVLCVAFVGWLNRKVLKNHRYFTALAIVGFFISKGANPPLGSIFFEIMFKYIPITHTFRNSYEKFGIIWLLPYAVFFSLGVLFFYQRFSGRARIVSTFTILFFACFILVSPMWNGSLYSANARVYVPSYYQTANEFIEKESKGGRILALPMIPGEGVKYNWEGGDYSGLEPSDLLFSRPVIAKTVRYKFHDDKYMELYNAFANGQQIDQILNETDVSYIIHHNELDGPHSGASTPAQVREGLKNYSSIKYVKSIGPLDLYEYTGFSDSIIEISNAVKYKYTKIGNQHYQIYVESVDEEFELVLKNSFNQLWKANVDGQKTKNHFIAYGYANGWRVDKRGDYTIDIIFSVWP